MASKLNLVVRLQHWMDSVPGQTFLNYAYSWGASVVILGALFKLTHLPGGNLMLFLGMGTEAFVFFLAAFDRPFDKKEINKDLAEDFETDEEIERAEAVAAARMGGYVGPMVVGGAPVVGGVPVGGGKHPVAVGGAPVVAGGAPVVGVETPEVDTDAPKVEETVTEETRVVGGAPVVGSGVIGGPAVVGGGTAIVGGGAPVVGGGAAIVGGGTPVVGDGTAVVGGAETPAEVPAVETPAAEVPAAEGAETPAAETYETPLQEAVGKMYGGTAEGAAFVEQEAKKLAEIIRLANDELLRRAQAVLSPEMEEATEEYIEKLHTLNETLAKVDEQSARLTRDSQEMENLNRTLIGINKVYDLHFASISRQVTTIEDINRQTSQLAAKIEEVNSIYTRMMIQLGVMVNPMGAAPAQPNVMPTQPAPSPAPVYGQQPLTAPVQTAAPVYATQPVAPAQPMQPSQPVAPAQPAAPAYEPSVYAAPTQPADPSAPAPTQQGTAE